MISSLGKTQAGVGLLEVLIALVVFTVGVVGMAGLQLRTLSMSLDSSQRTIVIAKSQDIADRIRSNGIRPVNYLGTYSNTNCSATPTPRCADSESENASACSEAEMAAFDIWDVFCGTDASMDSGVIGWTTTISCPGACTGISEQMSVFTTWTSRTSDTDQKLVNNTTLVNGVEVSTVTDQMTLSFVP